MIVAGIGLRQAATEAALRDALAAAGQAPQAIAVLSIKATPAVHAVAKSLALPLMQFDETDIADKDTLTSSPRVASRFVTGSVAEALALAGAAKDGQKARLLAPRVKSACGMATAALAERIPS